MKQIAFIHTQRFLLAIDYRDKAPFAPKKDIHTSYGSFLTTGEYVIKAGFLYDANWPAINTYDSIRGAGVHDFFYNLMKDGLLPRSFRYDVDYLFYNILLEDGMIPLRALGWFKVVRLGGDDAIDAPKPQIQYAPIDPRLIPNINRHKPLG
jgi:hypothetical protein